MKIEPEMNELDKLLCGKPPFDIWHVIEKAVNDPALASKCLDDEADRYAVYEKVAESLQAAFKKYHDFLGPEHEWALDNCNDVDTGVLLGVMNLMESWDKSAGGD